MRIDESKINKIARLLEQKSDEKYNKGDFKGAIKALRRSEKYLAKKNIPVWFFYKVCFYRYIVFLLLIHDHAPIYFGKFIIFFGAVFVSFLFSKN